MIYIHLDGVFDDWQKISLPIRQTDGASDVMNIYNNNKKNFDEFEQPREKKIKSKNADD